MKKTLLRVTFAAGLLGATVFGWPMDNFHKCKFECNKKECHECCVDVKKDLMERCQHLSGQEKNECLKEVTEGFVDCVQSCKQEKQECECECKSNCK